jgi:hypothetical protein
MQRKGVWIGVNMAVGVGKPIEGDAGMGACRRYVLPVGVCPVSSTPPLLQKIDGSGLCRPYEVGSQGIHYQPFRLRRHRYSRVIVTRNKNNKKLPLPSIILNSLKSKN